MVKHGLILFIVLLSILGCSGLNKVAEPDLKATACMSGDNDNHWNWGVWEFMFSDDHTLVDAIPIREAQYHYCITKLLEEDPCSNCLALGKPLLQPDGTVKLNVTVRHPFPTMPKYTGFDVRGLVYLPPTMIQKTLDLPYMSTLYNGYQVLPSPYSASMPLIFSRSDQGGGELLDADGYSCYLIPGVTYSKDWSIFSYSPPKYGNEPAPFSTINPYKLFASDTERRMFLVMDKITREYHFALPPGPFNFGYAVDASWWPPTTTPVTNPAVDFPPEANADDPWLIEYEQVLPICADNVGKDIFKVTVHHRSFENEWGADIWVWDLSTDCPPSEFGFSEFGFYVLDKPDDFTNIGYCNLFTNWWYHCGAGVVPGHHFAVLVVHGYEENMAPPYKAEVVYVYGVKFIDIYVTG